LQVQKSFVPLNDKSNNPAVDDTLTMMGFGDTIEGGSDSSVLLEAEVKYVDPNDCAEIISEYPVPADSMLCAMEDGADA
jgi:hypothetical protein